MTIGRKWTKKEVKDFADKLTAITLPMNVTFEGKQKILDVSSVDRIIDNSTLLAVTECECRNRVKGCDAPTDVCLYLNDEAQLQIEKGTGRQISKEEAYNILRKTGEAKLVHFAFIEKGNKNPKYICSCCACCCHSFAAIQKYTFDNSVVASDKIAEQNDELCDDCGICIDSCHFKARTMSGDKLYFEPKKCYGCGICVSDCPKDAIKLVGRSSA